jgi:eight-cysteine-cluster-containing protein
MRRHVLALLLLAGCSSPKKKTPDGPPPDVGPRPVAVVSSHPLFARLEQPTLKNACKADGDCHTGGCSDEMCTAEEGVTGPCDVVDKTVLAGAKCGCVVGTCSWYHNAVQGAPQGTPCPDGKCAPGLSCVTYLGIAGAKGPTFTSCETPCPSPKDKCPDGQVCVTIADGPGRVCRPK